MTFVPRRILVTGAAGFVGRHLLMALRRALPGVTLIGATRAGEMCTEADVTHCFDLLDTQGIKELVSLARPDSCVHLAATTEVGESFKDPDRVWRANVDGTRALAMALHEQVPACLLLFVSSAEVYGLSFQSGIALDESAALEPANPYAAAKAAADLALGEMALRGLRVIRMRPLNHIGPGQSPRFVVAAFARQIARIAAQLQEPVMRTGALDRWRDFLDVRDVCAAYVAAILRADDLPSGLALNIASGRVRKVSDVLVDLLRLAGVNARVEEAAAKERPTDLRETCCSADLASRLLDWKPQIAWETTLRDVLDYWRETIKAETTETNSTRAH